MTFREKYTELYKNVEKSGKILEAKLESISQINGFGEIDELNEYFKAQKDFIFHSNQFNNILKYTGGEKINPDSEFIDKEFIYKFIKEDQQRLGKDWKNGDQHPSSSNQGQFYSCEIGLTNDNSFEKNFHESFYKFPVLNLNHGKECYCYLNERLQYNPNRKFDIENLEFQKVLDENKPIYIKIKIRIT